MARCLPGLAPVAGLSAIVTLAACGDQAVDAPTAEDMDVLDIGDDYVLGLVRDDLDVERLRLHRLVKSPTPASER